MALAPSPCLSWWNIRLIVKRGNFARLSPGTSPRSPVIVRIRHSDMLRPYDIVQRMSASEAMCGWKHPVRRPEHQLRLWRAHRLLPAFGSGDYMPDLTYCLLARFPLIEKGRRRGIRPAMPEYRRPRLVSKRRRGRLVFLLPLLAIVCHYRVNGNRQM